MKIKRWNLSLLFLVTMLLMMTNASGADIDFFKIDRKGHLSEVMFVYNTDEAGCHSFSTRRKVHRISVIDYEYCSVFAKSSCAEYSVIKAKWKGRIRRNKRKKNPLSKLTQGSLWYLDPTTNVKIGSWYCKAKIEKD